MPERKRFFSLMSSLICHFSFSTSKLPVKQAILRQERHLSLDLTKNKFSSKIGLHSFTSQVLIHPKSHVCLFCLERKGWSDDFPTQVLLLFLSLSLKSNLPRNCKAPENSFRISIFTRCNPMIMIVTRLPLTAITLSVVYFQFSNSITR